MTVSAEDPHAAAAAAGTAATAPVITRQDVQLSLGAYAELLKASVKFHRKYAEVAQASLEFAQALEAMGRCKGAEQNGSGQGLKAAAELHRLVAKHQEQVADSIHKEFEAPLQRNLASHTKKTEENEKNYEKAMRKMQDEIGKTEGRMLKGRKKDLTVFQQSLQDMQRQAQEMEQLKVHHMERVLADEQKNFMFLVQKAAGVVKNEYDHFMAMSASSREVTEELITIAFAPAGKTLDAAEKRRVVDKFLGAPSSSSNTTMPSSSSASVVTECSGAELLRHHSTASTAFASRQSVMFPAGSHAVAAIATAAAAASEQIRSISPPISPTDSTGPTLVSTVPKAPAVATSYTHPRTLSELSTGDSSGAVLKQQLQGEESTELDAALERLNQAASKLMTTEDTAASHMTSPAPPPVAKQSADLVTAIHDFTARSDRELSFKKDDVLLVKQRQDSWLYAVHYGQPGSKSGWIPVSYTTKTPAA